MLAFAAIGVLAAAFKPEHALQPKGAGARELDVCIAPHYEKPSGTRSAMMKSQGGEDAYLDAEVFHGARDGVYLDIGCNDGILNSNTYYFNRALHWRGKCFEADPQTYALIASASGRHDGINEAVDGKEGVMPFTHFDGSNQLGGLQAGDGFDWNRANAIAHTTINVTTTTPRKLLAAHYSAPDMRTIDLVSLDIEGAEVRVMRAWDFDANCVNAFVIENNAWCSSDSALPELEAVLTPKGYEKRARIHVNEVFVRKEACPKVGK